MSLTKQQVFNKVVKHLFTQGYASVNKHNGKCMYRNTEGLSCAVVCLIPDEYYDDD